MTTFYERIVLIHYACKKHNIPSAMRRCYDSWQIVFPWCDGDIASNSETFGNSKQMVESYQFPWDRGDVSVLTVDDAIQKIIALYFIHELKKKKIFINP